MENTKQLYNPKVIEQKRAAYRLAKMKQDKRRVRTSGIREQSEISTGLMKRNMDDALQKDFEEIKDERPNKKIDNWLESLYNAREEAIAEVSKLKSKKGLGEIRPRSRDEGGLDPSLDEQSKELFSDLTFKENFDSILQEYPSITKYELLRIMDGESNFNPKARNEDTNASGLFQFIPKVAAELGFTPEEIRDMPPSSQLLVYKNYLKKWKYDGTYSLGLLQAAPRERNASPNTIIYKKGSDAWIKNPGWRDKETGNITKKSIDAYYRRNK